MRARSLRRSHIAVRLAVVALAGAAVVGSCAADRGPGAGGDGADATADRPAIRAAPSPFSRLERRFAEVVRAVSPHVVRIESPSGRGSGVVFDARGDVVTDAHVVGRVRDFVVTLSGGDQHRATLVAADRSRSLAVVRIHGATPAPATFADASSRRVGDVALAIGNALGSRPSVTQGIVSAVSRRVPGDNGVAPSPAMRTTAAINASNSGGALVDLSGRVIGIPTLPALGPRLSGQAPGGGFAIDSDTVRRFAGALAGS